MAELHIREVISIDVADDASGLRINAIGHDGQPFAIFIDLGLASDLATTMADLHSTICHRILGTIYSRTVLDARTVPLDRQVGLDLKFDTGGKTRLLLAPQTAEAIRSTLGEAIESCRRGGSGGRSH